MTTITEYLAEQKRLAEAQATAYARMLELNGGVGKLGVHHPEMFEDMLTWQDSTENEHADTVLRLMAALEAVVALHSREVIAVHEGYGEEAVCSPCLSYWPCSTIRAIEAALGGERDA